MTTRTWTPHEVEFVTDFDRPELAVSPWSGHRWFGYDLVRWAEPSRIVELGTHYGCSFFAFCQALQDGRSDAEVMAIDTWEGEEHSGRYGEEVFDFVTSTIERRFASVNTRIQRSLFDEALDLVPDGSVDILHIDGLHTYDAVSHDYRTWVDKVAPNGIVLFHDVAPSSGYGSVQFWQEIRDTGPGFAFLHSFGLGVLLPKGTEGREALLDMAGTSWRSYYAHRAGHDLRSRQVTDLSAMVEARDEALAATTRLVDERDETIVQLRTEIGEVVNLLGDTRSTLDQRQAALTQAELATTDLRRELAAVTDAGHRSAEAANRAEADRDSLAAEVEHLEHELASVTVDRDALAGNLELYRRAFRPIRWASRPPRRVLRRIRHGQLPAIGPGEQPLGEEADATPTEIDGLFDPEWYRARYPDVARVGTDPAAHWSDYGWKEGRQPCPLFDAGTYLRTSPDVATAGIDPLAHWAQSGWREARHPSALFATDFYRDHHRDLLGPDEDPLAHYLNDGIERGLFVHPDHEERVLTTRPLTATDDNILTDVIVDQGDGAPRSVPYAMVADLEADLFTFDLWDTILTRTRPADTSKLATARRLRIVLGLRDGQGPSTWELFRRRVEIEAEIAGPDNGEYLLGDVLTRQLGELVEGGHVERPTIEVEATVSALRHAELEDEMGSTRPIDETVLVMEKLLGRGASTRVAVISDFYLGADDLRELLWHHGVGDERVDVISSADLGRSKHNGGDLFRWARTHYGVEADRHVHIGDNPHADVAMQTATGGTAVHIVHGARRFAGPGQLDAPAMAAGIRELQADLDASADLRCRQAGLRPQPSDRIVRAAWRTALLPVALVAAAIEDAAARGLDRVHYLSREGLFLSRIHAEIAPILWPDHTPRAVHLAVSRRSTFGPSLAEPTAENLLDLWRMYPHQTPRGLLVSLGADAGDFASSLARFKLELDVVIDGIHLDERVASFLADDEVADQLSAVNTERRRALLGYLGGQTDLDLDRMIVVDVGWRGTIQDNLSRLLPQTRLIGWYLALFPFLNPQPTNGEKHAVGPDGNQGAEFAFMEPPAAVERPWTPAAPSVIDYRQGPAGIQPVLDEEALDQADRDAIALYQDAAVEAASTVARWIVANGASTDVLRPLIEDELAAYYDRPEPGIADLWFDSAHDDTFGVLNVTSFGKQRPDRSWFRHGLGPGYLRHLDAAAQASLWPAGYQRWRPVEAASVVERAIRSNSFGSGGIRNPTSQGVDT